ncbi:MAG TPA: MFS transporter [Candidatus Angelobacter sp.]|jgi:ACS family hexuronate transporter-like MFS transporter|nr:MFS transporter [Candidatus Angelobacter sp.]
MDSTIAQQSRERTGAGSAVLATITHYRWVICALLFFATTINYVDRQIIGLLKQTLQGQIGWNEIDFSNVVFAFQLAYAVGLLFAGGILDRIGTRRGFSLSVFFWSIAAMAHALAHSVVGFGAARVALGLGESGNFPACIKAVAEWFPKKERSLATGIFNSGTNVGALTTPFLVAWITGKYGWRGAFIATGAIGFLWLVVWLVMYRSPESHPRVSRAELDYIRSDAPEQTTRIPWIDLIPHRQTWAFAIGKFMTDPIWWLYLFWLPDFLYKTHGITLSNVGLPSLVIYQMATVGSIAGGWFSSAMIKRGWTINRSRKTAMLICALAVVPIIFAAKVSSLWAAVGLIGLAAAGHQGWSANIFTLASDTFPRRAVGSVVGLGGMFGALGGLLISKVTGYVLQWTGSYLPMFIIAGSAYLIALAIIHFLNPQLKPAPVGEPA